MKRSLEEIRHVFKKIDASALDFVGNANPAKRLATGRIIVPISGPVCFGAAGQY